MCFGDQQYPSFETFSSFWMSHSFQKISENAVFGEDFTSPLSKPDLPSELKEQYI